MTIKKHTPAPWHVDGNGCSIATKGGQIAKIRPVYMDRAQREANAEFIVRSVNSHEALIDACKDALKALVVPRIITPYEAIDRIETALKLAGE